MIPSPTLPKRLLEYRNRWQSAENPLISFPIATYNREDIVITRTLPSIMHQSYQNIEIVIVGDASGYVKLSDFVCSDSRIKFYDLNKRTLYPSNGFDVWCVAGHRPRNIAARLCKGDWHWWISDDDTLEEDAVDKVVRYASKNLSVESIFGWRGYRDLQNNFLLRTTSPDIIGSDMEVGGMPSWINRSYLSRLFKWNSQSYRNESNKPGDLDLQSRMIENGVKFGILEAHLSTSWAVDKYDGLHGSQLYKNFDEVWK